MKMDNILFFFKIFVRDIFGTSPFFRINHRNVLCYFNINSQREIMELAV